MFQKGTGERFKYRQAVLDKYPTARSEGRMLNRKWYAIYLNDKRVSDAFLSAESAWADAYYQLFN